MVRVQAPQQQLLVTLRHRLPEDERSRKRKQVPLWRQEWGSSQQVPPCDFPERECRRRVVRAREHGELQSVAPRQYLPARESRRESHTDSGAGAAATGTGSTVTNSSM